MSLLNRAKVRQLLLDQAALARAHKFTRVSKESLDTVEAKLRNVCMEFVKSLPSKGKTI